MGLFSRKKNKNNPYVMPVMNLQTDVHSHILPGIDDGAETVEDSIQMLKSFIRQGYNKVITTPHIHTLRYRNTQDTIRRAYDELMREMEKENINLVFEYAAEYYADSEFLKLIRANEILSISAEKYVLVEFSFQMPPVGTDRIFGMLADKGYQPVVAHPERYEYWHGNAGLFERLKKQGYLFQSNLHSAAGQYGIIPQRNFEMLANNGWIDMLGSDAHSPYAVDMIEKTMKLPVVQKVMMNGVRNHSL